MNQFIQVLINLIPNAFDAIGEKTYPSEVTPQIQITGSTSDGLSILSVRDNGSGIPHEHLPKIFEPFYTSKDVGVGMGLGLSICHQIVSSHGGRITVSSAVGQFTEFALEFPSARPRVQVRPYAGEAP